MRIERFGGGDAGRAQQRRRGALAARDLDRFAAAPEPLAWRRSQRASDWRLPPVSGATTQTRSCARRLRVQERRRVTAPIAALQLPHADTALPDRRRRQRRNNLDTLQHRQVGYHGVAHRSPLRDQCRIGAERVGAGSLVDENPDVPVHRCRLCQLSIFSRAGRSGRCGASARHTRRSSRRCVAAASH